MWSISYRLKKLCDIWRNYSGQILRFFLNFVFQFNYTAIDSKMVHRENKFCKSHETYKIENSYF